MLPFITKDNFMKKSLLSIGILTILGAIWSGSAWYTGKLVEENYAHYAELSTQKLNTYLVNTPLSLKIENMDFKRGVFDSNISYILQLNNSETNQHYEIPFYGKVYHGPITLNDFSLALFAVEIGLEKNTLTSFLFKNDGGSPLKTSAKMTYGKQVKGDIYSDIDIAISSESKQNKLEWQLRGTFDVDQDGIGKRSLQIPRLTIVNNQQGSLNIEDAEVDIDLLKRWNNLFFGEHRFQVKKLSFTDVTKQNSIIFDRFTSELSLKPNDQISDLNFNYDVNNIDVNNVPLVGLKLKGEINHIDSNLFDNLFTQLSEKNGISNDVIKIWVNKSINSGIEFKIDDFSLLNEKGKALFANIDVNIAKDAISNIEKNGNIFSSFEDFYLKISLDKNAIYEFLQNITNITGEDSKLELEKKKLDTVFQTALQNNWLIETEKGAELKVYLDKDKNKIVFNKQEFSEQDLRVFLMLLVMQLGIVS